MFDFFVTWMRMADAFANGWKLFCGASGHPRFLIPSFPAARSVAVAELE